MCVYVCVCARPICSLDRPVAYNSFIPQGAGPSCPMRGGVLALRYCDPVSVRTIVFSDQGHMA